MEKPIRLVLAVLLLGIAGFCVFGFLATFEPLPRDVLAWRFGYGASILAALSGAWYLARRAFSDG